MGTRYIMPDCISPTISKLVAVVGFCLYTKALARIPPSNPNIIGTRYHTGDTLLNAKGWRTPHFGHISAFTFTSAPQSTQNFVFIKIILQSFSDNRGFTIYYYTERFLLITDIPLLLHFTLLLVVLIRYIRSPSEGNSVNTAHLLYLPLRS